MEAYDKAIGDLEFQEPTCFAPIVKEWANRTQAELYNRGVGKFILSSL